VINYQKSFSRIESRRGYLKNRKSLVGVFTSPGGDAGAMKGKGTRMHPTRRGWLATPLVLILLTLGMILPMSAQENTGRVDGTVVDSTGSVIPDAKISASAPTLPREIETVSDGSGNFAFTALPPGTYMITISKVGFQTTKLANVQVALGSKITLSPKLSVGTVSQTVEVADTAVSLDVSSSLTATNITSDIASELPRGRNFNSLLNLAPGVRLEPKSGTAGVGGVSVDGASGSENIFVIDGVEVSDTLNGSLRRGFNIPFEFLSEVQVKSGGFDSEFGGANGGVINIATKSGTNTFHGEGFYQIITSVMNPRPRGLWQGSPLNADVADFFAPTKDVWRNQYPGFTIGGPILKNRIYFFAGYSPELTTTIRTNRYDSSAQTVAANRTFGTRQYQQDVKQHYSLMRVDYAATQKLQINSSWTWSPLKINGTLPSTDIRRAPPGNDLSVTGGYAPSQAFAAGATYTVTPTFILSARYGYRYLNDKATNYGLPGLPYYTYQTASSASKVPVDPAFAGSNGFSSSSSTLLTARDITTRNNVYLDATKLFELKGQHSLKFGYALNRQTNDVATDYTNGRFLVNWGDTFNRGSVTGRTGTYGYYTWEDGVRLNSQVLGRNQGFYVQDSWKIHRRVTLNLGVRFENEFLPPYKKEQAGVQIANPVTFGWGEKIAPRLGAAWDITGNGAWKLSGGYASIFDVMKFNLARGSFGGEFWVTHVYELNSAAVSSLSKANPGVLGKEIISYDNRTLPINSAGVIDGNDPDMKPYQTREWHITLDHQLNSRLVAGARFVRKVLVNSIDDIGVLDSEDNEVYLIGNPGRGLTRDTKSVYGQKTPNGQEFLVPQATRNYTAVEFNIRGRLTNHLLVNSSYTYSRLYGNYAGQANSDENGRSNPNNDRAFDLPFYYFDASGSQKNVYGLLATDRPSTFKLYTAYDLKTRAGTTYFGLTQNAWSGTPISTSVIYQSAPTYPNGRGDLGRTPVYTQTDINISHAVPINERVTIRFEANALNVFNQAAVTNVQQQINRNGAITAAQLPVSKFFSGYKLSDFVNASNSVPAGNPGCAGSAGTNGVCALGARISPIYRLPISFQAPRELRLGFRVVF